MDNEPNAEDANTENPYTEDPYTKEVHALTQEERNWGVAAHLIGPITMIFALGLVGLLGVYLIFKKNESPFIRANALEALNFNIAAFFALAVSLILIIAGIGILLVIAVSIAYLVFSVLGALKARDGEVYRYPVSLRLIK